MQWTRSHGIVPFYRNARSWESKEREITVRRAHNPITRLEGPSRRDINRLVTRLRTVRLDLYQFDWLIATRGVNLETRRWTRGPSSPLTYFARRACAPYLNARIATVFSSSIDSSRTCLPSAIYVFGKHFSFCRFFVLTLVLSSFALHILYRRIGQSTGIRSWTQWAYNDSSSLTAYSLL